MLDPISLLAGGGIAVLAVGVMEWRLRAFRRQADYAHSQAVGTFIELRHAHERATEVALAEMKGQIANVSATAQKSANHVHPLPEHRHDQYALALHEHSVPEHQHPTPTGHQHRWRRNSEERTDGRRLGVNVCTLCDDRFVEDLD